MTAGLGMAAQRASALLPSPSQRDPFSCNSVVRRACHVGCNRNFISLWAPPKRSTGSRDSCLSAQLGKWKEGSSAWRSFRGLQGSHGSQIRVHKKVKVVAAVKGEGGDGGNGEEEVEEVVIVGAGVAGLATAVALQRVGIKAIVLEQAESLRQGGAALSLWGNAWKALDVLGVAEELREGFTPHTRVEICSDKGRLLRQFTIAECVDGPHEVRGVTRSALLAALADKLPPGSIRFAARPAKIRAGKSSTTIVELEGGETLTTKVLLGCDGVRSMVAQYLGLGPVNYCGYAAFRGVARGQRGGGGGETIRMAWGEGVRAGLYALTDTDVYWFTCFNAPQGEGLATSKEGYKELALAAVKGWDCGVEEAIRQTPADLISRSEISDRWTLPLPGARWGRGGVTVLGDAAHPMTPNLGQGGGTSLEDAVVLARELASCCTVQLHTSHGGSKMSAQGGRQRKGAMGMEGEVLREGGGGSVSVVEGERERRREGEEEERRRVLGDAGAIAAALERFDTERIRRTAPLTVRSHVIGAVLQSAFPPICFLRNNVLAPLVIKTKGFLEHALYDCGALPEL